MSYCIYIPTLNRIGEQRTADRLANIGVPYTLVCPPDEVEAHSCFHPAIACPEKGISRTRDWIMSECVEDVCVMLDDDLDFQVRIDRDDLTAWKLRQATDEELEALLDEMAELALQYPMVGLSPRPGNNRYGKERIVFNQRMFSIYAVNKKVFSKLQCVFCAVPLMEDFFIALRFLTAGYKLPMIVDHTWWQKESNAEGGCSTYRDGDLQKQAALQLQELFPDFVKVKKKATKHGWFGDERYDVTIQWKKAYEHGLSNRYL